MIREKTIIQLINQFGTIQNLFSHLYNTPILSENWKNTFAQQKGRVLMNARLVDFLEMQDSEFESGIITASFNPPSLRLLYRTLGFSISRVDKRLMTHDEKQQKVSFFKAQSPERV
jgi:5'-3' exonuclease